jgi:hypothetical protein
MKYRRRGINSQYLGWRADYDVVDGRAVGVLRDSAGKIWRPRFSVAIKKNGRFSVAIGQTGLVVKFQHEVLQ